MADVKVCSFCKVLKPRADFYVNKARVGGLQARCIACCKARQRGKTPEERARLAVDGFAARFWAKVDRRGPDECWEWTGYRHQFGYGLISRVGRHAMLTAHRVSWEMRFGTAGDLHVCHRCDNPPCVNPAHLFLGTHQDNMKDMAAKGRASQPPVRRGSANNKAKLTEEMARQIRETYAAGGVSIRQLARQYGVTFAPVQMLIAGKTWRHI